MTDDNHDRDASRYRIRVSGHLDPRREAWFGDHTLRPQPDGTTLIEADAVDQAALHGLLRQVRDAGLGLLSVTRVDAPVD